MDIKEKYLSNPHITLTPELQDKLGITSQDLKRRDRMLGNIGPAVEIEVEEPQTYQQVVVRKKKGTKNVDSGTKTD